MRRRCWTIRPAGHARVRFRSQELHRLNRPRLTFDGDGEIVDREIRDGRAIRSITVTSIAITSAPDRNRGGVGRLLRRAVGATNSRSSSRAHRAIIAQLAPLGKIGTCPRPPTIA